MSTERQRKTDGLHEVGEGINICFIPPKGPQYRHHHCQSIVQLYSASRPKCLFPVTVSAKPSPTRSTSSSRSLQLMTTAMTASVRVAQLTVCRILFLLPSLECTLTIDSPRRHCPQRPSGAERSYQNLHQQRLFRPASPPCLLRRVRFAHRP